MKRILIALLILVLAFSVVACGSPKETDADTNDTAADTKDTGDTESDTEESETDEIPTEPETNKGEFKAGVYKATSSYASGEMNMTWNFVLTLKADGTFSLSNDANEEKGAGTYALTDTCYTMTYSDERSCTFVVTEDGKLKMTSDFPYGVAQIQLALVGDIVFTFDSEVPGGDSSDEGNNEEKPGDKTFSIAAGNYAASYLKESPMAGSVEYKYTATVGADGTFSYKVTFEMGGTAYDGAAANGTYTVDGNKFVFTDSEGNVTEGKLTAENTLVISLKASAMASSPYEVTFAPATYSVAAGNYAASYLKESPMAGSVEYKYTATVGADGTFSYKVTFEMGGTAYDGAAAGGTYTVNGSAFVFTDSEGNVTEGKITADNTIVISLKASAMAKEPYEVTFTVAEA